MTRLPGHLPVAPESSRLKAGARLVAQVPDRNVQRLAGLVIATGRTTAEVEIDGQPWRLTSTGPMPEQVAAGQRVRLEVVAPAAGGHRAALLVAVDGRALKPPFEATMHPRVPVQPAATAATGPSGMTVIARPLEPSAVPTGTILQLRLQPALPQPETDALATPAPDPGTAARPLHENVSGARQAGSAGSPAAAGPAIVIGRDPSGRTLLELDGQLVRLDESLELPPGTRLQAVVLAAHSPPTKSASAGLPPLLQAVVQMLGLRPEGSPLQLPLPDDRLAARILTLGRASSGGSAAADPGDRIGAELKQALSDLGQQAHEPLPGGWRLLQVPFGHPAEPCALRLFQRDDTVWPDEPQDPDRELDERAQRAVFEVEFSRLGRCQLDVLCQRRRFDLAVRTETALASDLQAEIRALYSSACELAGLAGQVSFASERLLDLPGLPDPGRDITV